MEVAQTISALAPPPGADSMRPSLRRSVSSLETLPGDLEEAIAAAVAAPSASSSALAPPAATPVATPAPGAPPPPSAATGFATATEAPRKWALNGCTTELELDDEDGSGGASSSTVPPPKRPRHGDDASASLPAPATTSGGDAAGAVTVAATAAATAVEAAAAAAEAARSMSSAAARAAAMGAAVAAQRAIAKPQDSRLPWCLSTQSLDSQALEEVATAGRAEPQAAASAAAAAPAAPRAAGAAGKGRGRGLTAQGMKEVGGFEVQGLRVAARVGKKLPKTQSWCFVPLIYSALGRVPDRLRKEGISDWPQIEAAQGHWRGLFSHWEEWRLELRKVIEAYGPAKFEADFLPRGDGGARGWTTSLVYGEPREWGKLPHPQGRCQDAMLNLLPCDTQNQIFASVIAITVD